jgi:hypothetical protein
MHQQFVNCTKHLFNAQMDNWQLDENEVDEIAGKIKLPKCFSTWSFPFSESHKFKAINWKYWTLYISIPALHHLGDSIPKSYMSHWERFVLITLYTCCQSISSSALEHLKTESYQFAVDHANHFPVSSSNPTIHIESHIGLDIERFGLMSSHAEWVGESKVFPFGVSNFQLGIIASMKTGTQQLPREMMLVYTESLAKQHYFEQEKLETSGKNIYEDYYSGDRIKLLTVAELKKLNEELQNNQIDPCTSARLYRRIHNSTFDWEPTETVQFHGTDDSALLWRDEQQNIHYGIIQKILVITNPTNNLLFIVDELTSLQQSTLHFKIFKSLYCQKLVLARTNSLHKLFHCKLGSLHYVCEVVENLELD